jgi:hypothetical protein
MEQLLSAQFLIKSGPRYDCLLAQCAEDQMAWDSVLLCILTPWLCCSSRMQENDVSQFICDDLHKLKSP